MSRVTFQTGCFFSLVSREVSVNPRGVFKWRVSVPLSIYKTWQSPRHSSGMYCLNKIARLERFGNSYRSVKTIKIEWVRPGGKSGVKSVGWLVWNFGKDWGTRLYNLRLREESPGYSYLNRSRLKYKEVRNRVLELQTKVCIRGLRTNTFNLLSSSRKFHIV